MKRCNVHMDRRNVPLSYRLFSTMNFVYSHAFFLYKPFYFAYKYKSERKKIRFLENILTPGMTILDIGANIGFYSVLFSKLMNNTGTVHAFEPDPANFVRLTKVTAGIPCIQRHQAAVAEKSGTIKLYHSEKMNVDHRVYDSGDHRRVSEVSAVCIDDYFKENVQKVDIVKLDIQGADFAALKGMQNTINRSDGVIIISELWPYGLRKAGTSVDEYISFLASLNIRIHMFDDISLDECRNNSDNEYFYTDFYGSKES
ncbi:MAG: FkbM family methyltransferase [Chitinivibrionales bacterium]|nr:FkbM family methyltransferase [Chitinivibrionales bacterium]